MGLDIGKTRSDRPRRELRTAGTSLVGCLAVNALPEKFWRPVLVRRENDAARPEPVIPRQNGRTHLVMITVEWTENGNVSRSGREAPRERDSRDRRATWETSGAIQSASDPQKGLSLLLQRAGVSGILGDFGSRSGGVSLPKPLAPSGVSSSLSRGRPAGSWNGRPSAHSRPMVSSQSLPQSAPANPSARVGRPPVMSDSGRSWPTSVDKDRERVRERDRGVATREMSRSSWSGSANPASLMASHAVGHDRARQVVAAGRTTVPPRMVSQHSAGQPIGVTAPSMMDSRRAVAMSGRGDAFRSGVPGLPRSTTMRRY